MTAATITLFSSNKVPTGPELDNNFLAYAVFGSIPVTVSGTNALTIAQNVNTPTLPQLTNYIQFTGVFVGGNTGAVTITHPSFGTLNAYKDSPAGPVLFSGGECQTGNAFSARYDSALNSGAGGYHLSTSTGFSGGTISGSLAQIAVFGTVSTVSTVGATLTSALLTGNSLTVQAAGLQVGTLGSTLATMTRMLSGLGTLTFTVTPANTSQDQNIVLPGAQIRDVVAIGLGTSVPAGAGFTGFCGTLGTVTVRLINPTGSSISLTTMTVRAMAMGLTP